MNNQRINLPEVFTPEERNENAQRKRELIELVVSGEAVLIVGAGSSGRVGYVSWNGLLGKLEELAIQCGDGLNQDRKNDLLAYAEDIKSHIIEKTGSLKRYHDCLYELFIVKIINIFTFFPFL